MGSLLALVDLTQSCWSKWCICLNSVVSFAPLRRMHHNWLEYFLGRRNLKQILGSLFEFCARITSLEVLEVLKVRILCHCMLSLH